MKFANFYPDPEIRFYVENLERITRLVQFKNDIEETASQRIAETLRNALRHAAAQSSSPAFRELEFEAFSDDETYVMFSTPDLYDWAADRGMGLGISDLALSSLERGALEPPQLLLFSHSKKNPRQRAAWWRQLFALAKRERRKLERMGATVSENIRDDYPVAIPLPMLNLRDLRASPEEVVKEVVSHCEALATFWIPRLKALNPLGLSARNDARPARSMPRLARARKNGR